MSTTALGLAVMVLVCAPAAASSPAGPQVGLRVHPPVMRIADVVPGVDVVLPAPITIENGGARSILCGITPIRPSSIGIRGMDGYTDMPDPLWCRIDQDTVTLRPGESRSVWARLSVPPGACNANRCWCVAFSVQTLGHAPLGAAVYPYVYVETSSDVDAPRPPQAADGARAQPSESRRGTGARHDSGRGTSIPASGGAEEAHAGCLIIGPGVLDAGDVAPGTTARAGSMTVMNCYDEDIVLKISPFVPEARGLARNVLITPGHTWVEDTEWLRPGVRGLPLPGGACELSLPAGEEAEVYVDVVSPGNPSRFNFRWEGYLKFESPRGPEALVRVRWRTVSREPERAAAGGD